MNDNQLHFEAGVYYRFPRNDESAPIDMKEYSYERFRDGKSYGIGHVFVLGHQPIEFHKLIESWNRKGARHGYCYVALVTA